MVAGESLVASINSSLQELKKNWRSDIIAGFLVFLIALPLCLGISMASGFPPTAGIITAVIGGILVSRINGSHLTINGPAAGLIVVILSANQALGQGDPANAFRYTLAAIVVASLFQMAMGLIKAGRLNAFFPSSVVHGLLAAIGFIIIAKQIHVMLGVKVSSPELVDAIMAIPSSFVNANLEVAFIGFASLAALIVWSKVKNKYLKMVPAPIVVVSLGMLLAKYFDLDHEHVYLFKTDFSFLPQHEFSIGPKFLVNLPANIKDSFFFPNFSKIATREFWSAVLSIGLVGSLETMLSTIAVDKLDPQKRTSNLDKDLTAIGIGNFICGMLGGLPMIAEIVRSSANINNGAKTSWSNFFHGAFLLIFVAFFPFVIHEIPLASLAALLVYTGFRLASPKEFAKTLQIGWEQLTIFVVTIIGCVFVDLLVGVGLGIATKVVIHTARGVSPKNLFRLFYEEESDEANYKMAIDGSIVFSNFIQLRNKLNTLPEGMNVTIDLSRSKLVDHTVMEYLSHFQHDYNLKGGTFVIVGLDFHVPTSGHQLSSRLRPVNFRAEQLSIIETPSEGAAANVNAPPENREQKTTDNAVQP